MTETTEPAEIRNLLAEMERLRADLETAIRVRDAYRRQRDQAERVLFRIAKAAGADLDGARSPNDRAGSIAADVLGAVSDLRADYDETARSEEAAHATIARVRQWAEQTASQSRGEGMGAYIAATVLKHLDSPEDDHV
ncbi:hypothetical protein [Planobispora rosea]|uniref:hypothetical protein n=1 Tax=Planobispora rosea TaxID=35762 RepID=UPI000839F0BA|nr:hypothetical protein [Planobispora rosea]